MTKKDLIEIQSVVHSAVIEASSKPKTDTLSDKVFKFLSIVGIGVGSWGLLNIIDNSSINSRQDIQIEGVENKQIEINNKVDKNSSAIHTLEVD